MMSVSEQGRSQVARQPGARRALAPAEAVLIGLILLSALTLAAMAVAFGQPVAWGALAIELIPGTFLIGFGIYARLGRSMPRLALLLVAVGFYSNFGNISALCIYMRFPFDAGTIDPLLASIDARLGYVWVDWVAAAAAIPLAGKALALVYMSSLGQLLVVMVALAWLRREADLHRFLLVGSLGLVLTAVIWWLAPSLGPSALDDIPTQMSRAASLVVDGAYGAELRRLAAEGSPILSPEQVMGVIAFPSYHIFMACLTVWFARRTPLMVPAVLLSLLMVPATLLQGGHHLVDLAAGMVVFVVTLLAVTWALPDRADPAP